MKAILIKFGYEYGIIMPLSMADMLCEMNRVKIIGYNATPEIFSTDEKLDIRVIDTEDIKRNPEIDKIRIQEHISKLKEELTKLEVEEASI